MVRISGILTNVCECGRPISSSWEQCAKCFNEERPTVLNVRHNFQEFASETKDGFGADWQEVLDSADYAYGGLDELNFFGEV